MKVTLIETSCPNQIFIDNIHNSMIYVARHPRSNNLVILHSKNYYAPECKWRDMTLNFTLGNGYTENESLREAVIRGMTLFNNVFAFKTWQEAFTWALQ